MTLLDIPVMLELDWPSAQTRAAWSILATLHKSIPALVDEEGPYDVDWNALEEWSGPWSNTEKIRVRLARSIAQGDLADAACSFDDRNWKVLTEALSMLRGR